eukprot:TRINITY_DN17146_c0_g1_i1.p1 TRINITY_DN17146_c0_g1~~TRINITY_DN17146_c0_g1_i1.p1  ORF type:complete len:147 (-),score=0.38 TRINITY_DN17146_c0_g1_i1:351-791(-)
MLPREPSGTFEPGSQPAWKMVLTDNEAQLAIRKEIKHNPRYLKPFVSNVSSNASKSFPLVACMRNLATKPRRFTFLRTLYTSILNETSLLSAFPRSSSSFYDDSAEELPAAMQKQQPLDEEAQSQLEKRASFRGFQKSRLLVSMTK